MDLGNYDKAYSSVDTRISQLAKVVDNIERDTKWYIRRWESPKDQKTQTTYEDKEAVDLFGMPQNTTIDGNILVNEGINEMWLLVGGTGATLYNNANAQLVVGTSTTGENASNTYASFSGAVTKGMDTTFPTTGSNQKIIFRSTYASGEANQAWNEFGCRNGSSRNKLLNRKVSSQGTKQSGQTWELTLEITLS